MIPAQNSFLMFQLYRRFIETLIVSTGGMIGTSLGSPFLAVVWALGLVVPFTLYANKLEKKAES